MDIQRVAHIYFDLDGTLVDPREGIAGNMRRPA
jgi:phosphoglycolate phosphatase-like HAD superfamily hydrolase